MSPDLIASFGMNCALCANYLALVNDLKSKGIRMPYCIDIDREIRTVLS